MLINFPNPRTYNFPEWVLIGDYFYHAGDIIYFGGELNPENLKTAYRQGIFPWTIQGISLPWFCPEKRAILEFGELHIPKSLRKLQKKNSYTLTLDKAFEKVISICSKIKRSGERGTWITEDFIAAYGALHAHNGAAHSVEVWEGNELVGGLYGVDAGGVFCGESMFHLRPNTSKLALLFLIEHLKSRGAAWLDVQVLTPHLKILGAREIARDKFLEKLAETQKKNLKLF
ncbi:MAG: leucyl/phenylalanyl-tRNA--protein transferase [Pyrinomonadaceae bacterium]